MKEFVVELDVSFDTLVFERYCVVSFGGNRIVYVSPIRIRWVKFSCVVFSKFDCDTTSRLKKPAQAPFFFSAVKFN